MLGTLLDVFDTAWHTVGCFCLTAFISLLHAMPKRGLLFYTKEALFCFTQKKLCSPLHALNIFQGFREQQRWGHPFCRSDPTPV